MFSTRGIQNVSFPNCYYKLGVLHKKTSMGREFLRVYLAPWTACSVTMQHSNANRLPVAMETPIHSPPPDVKYVVLGLFYWL